MKARFLFSLSLALTVLSCRRSDPAPKKEAETAASASQLVFNRAQIEHGGVRWEAAASSTAAPAIELPGQLVPNEDQTARMGAPAEGRVLRVIPHVGDRVSIGELVVILQGADASAARADVTKARAEITSRQAALAYARSARERAERLLEAKAGSRQELERARADEELAQSALAQAEAELARAAAAAAHLGVNSTTGEMVLRSPIAGIVLGRDAVPGSVVQPGAALVAISDVRTLWLEVAAPERSASALRPGQPIRFTVPAFPEETFEARIANVGGSLDPQTRTLPVRAVVENTAGKLRPAMFATVLLEAGAQTPGISVPDAAVVLVDERPVVFVAKPKSDGGADFERRDVEIGSKADGHVFLLRGVRPGEPVVVTGAFAVKSQLERSKLPSE